MDFQLKLSDTDANLGMALRRLGRRDESRRAYEQARQRREELAQQHPDNVEVQLKLAQSCRALADEQRDAGRPDEALATLRKGHAAADSAARADPSLIRAQAELAACLFNLGEVCRIGGRAEALRQLARAFGALDDGLQAGERVARPEAAQSGGGLGRSYDALRRHRAAEIGPVEQARRRRVGQQKARRELGDHALDQLDFGGQQAVGRARAEHQRLQEFLLRRRIAAARRV